MINQSNDENENLRSCKPTFSFVRNDEHDKYVSQEWCAKTYRISLDISEEGLLLYACLSIFDEKTSVLCFDLTKEQFIQALFLHPNAFDYLLTISEYKK